MAELTKLGETEFENEVLKSETPVVVLFKGEWCPGCKAVLPIVEELSDEGTKAFYVDVSESPAVAGRYGVMSIPTTIVFSGGEAKATFVGSVAKEKIEGELK